MAESQNPTIPATLRRRYIGYLPLRRAQKPSCIYVIAAMAPLFDNTKAIIKKLMEIS